MADVSLSPRDRRAAIIVASVGQGTRAVKPQAVADLASVSRGIAEPDERSSPVGVMDGVLDGVLDGGMDWYDPSRMTVATSDEATQGGAGGRSLSPGSVFAGRYLIERTVGEGGMGSVHAAVDQKLGERVALKVLSAVGSLRADALERFRREVRVAHQVTHRNVARTFDIGEHEGLHFLTMELVEGESLAERLRAKGRLGVERVIDIGRQICAGLVAVHEAGLVHRDLKPANVLLESGGRVVLTDFGIARSTIEDDAITVDREMLIGTPRYMAPEQVSGEPLTARSDLYTLGLVLYEMATGRLPFGTDTAIATAVARLQQSPEPPQRHVDLPPSLVNTIMACLERDAARRPSSASAVKAMLGELGAVDGAATDAATDVTMVASASTVRDVVAPSGGTRFASVYVGDHSLAVLPLRYRGPSDDAYLAEALTEQLIDLLSMTRGLRVPAAGATEPFVDRRDPRAVREALGVDSVVDGTMQKGGSHLRVAIRLLDARTGYQTWSERFDGELEDVFQLQDRIATRVAETLRLRLQSSRFEYSASQEVMELYMRARVSMRSFKLGAHESEGAPALLERCLALAPDFPPALAAYAVVCSRMWFYYGEKDGAHEWAALCRQAVARALEVAPGLPDAHLAAARMHWQQGEFRRAAQALQQTLDLAPTYAAAHGYLGILQCEAGRGKEGLQHIDLAVELEPTALWPLLTAARYFGMRGDMARFDAIMERVWKEAPDSRPAIKFFRLRVAMWSRDHNEIRRARDVLAQVDRPNRPFVEVVAGYVLGEASWDDVQASLAFNAPPTASPRYRAMLEQGLVEGLLVRDELEPAIEIMERLAQEVLVDVDWLEHCSLMEAIAEDPRMSKIRTAVHQRAQAIWMIE
ncbi:MAG: protein kinase [Myxococcota bacterium]